MSRKNQLIKNTLIIGLGKVSTQFVAFCLLPLYTYFLSPSEFGAVDLVLTYIVLLVPALTLQLEMASFRFLVDIRKDRILQASVISNITYTLFLLITPAVIGLVVFGVVFDYEYFEEVILAGLAMAFAGLFLQIARGLGDNKQFAIASIVIGLVNALTAIWFIAFLGMKGDGMLLSIAVANAVGAAYLILRMRIYRYVRPGQYDRRLQREILGYSLPLVPNGVAWWVINVSDRTIITILINIAANGIYAVSSKYASIFSSIFSIFSMSWTESASLHINAKDRDKFFSDVHNAAIRFFGALGLCLIAVIPFVFPLLVDQSFKEAYYYIPILIVGAFFNAVVGLYSAIYVAKKLTKQVMNTSLAAAALNISLTISLVPFFGLYAAAFATAVAFLVMAVFRHYDIKKHATITYQSYLFVALALLYVAVIGLYYMDGWAMHLIGLTVAVVAGLILNRGVARIIKNKAAGYLKP